MRRRLLMPLMCLALASLTIGCAGAAGGGGGIGPFSPQYNLPPAERLMRPGPGVDGPGPGIIPPSLPPGVVPVHAPPVQVLFNSPESVQVRYDVGAVGLFDSEPIIAPGRANFAVGAIYRLKLTNIVGREGVELYPTLEIGPVTPRSAAFLEHNAIPVQFTDEDIDQVLTGNYVTKVIYLPDPEFQELALAGVDTLVSTRLDPGVDPITEADRRGAILAVARLGNKDLEMYPPGMGHGEVVPAQYGVPAGAAPQGYTAPPGAMPLALAPSHLGPGGAVGSPHMGNPYGGPGGPMPMAPVPAYPGTIPPPYIAGVTAPEWGMPYSGTPIGIPGPPHIPQGGPAGLQQHVMKNQTKYRIPGPVARQEIFVKKRPGYTYPNPPSHAYIKEETIHPAVRLRNTNTFQRLH